MYKKRGRGWLKHIDFSILDIICMQLAFIASFYIRFKMSEGWVYSHDLYGKMAILIVLIEIFVAFFMDSYKDILKRGYFVELVSVIKVVIITWLVLVVYLYLTKQSADYSRSFQAIFLTVALAFMYTGRLILKVIVRGRLENKDVANRMLIVGMKENIADSIRDFSDKSFLDAVVVGAVVMDADIKGEIIQGIPIVANASDVCDYVAGNVVDEVFVNGTDQSTCEEYAEIFLEMGVTVHINLIRVSRLMPNRMVESYGNFIVLTSSMKVATPKQLLIKRLVDIIGGIVGVLITLIFAVIFGPVIKIQSPGPIFFKQVRVGKNGRKFNMYKFRTMVPNAEELKKDLMDQNEMEGNMFKMENDPRIIPIGRFMRRYSIDEFPQFFSVIRGDMSLVGTRPPTVDEYEKYDLHHRARLGSKPGITGLWQVSGRSNITDFEKIVELDTKYIEEWTLSGDIKILWKTIKVVVEGEGAC